MNENKVICRPCKEQNNWEIQMPSGQVNSKHYQTKNECVNEGKKLAEEYGCDLVVESSQHNQSNNQNLENTKDDNYKY